MGERLIQQCEKGSKAEEMGEREWEKEIKQYERGSEREREKWDGGSERGNRKER
jgi:hypothetical protein